MPLTRADAISRKKVGNIDCALVLGKILWRAKFFQVSWTCSEWTNGDTHMNGGAKYFRCKHARSSPHFYVLSCSNMQLARFMTAQSISSFLIIRHEDLASCQFLNYFRDVAALRFRMFLCRSTTVWVWFNHDSYLFSWCFDDPHSRISFNFLSYHFRFQLNSNKVKCMLRQGKCIMLHARWG